MKQGQVSHEQIIGILQQAERGEQTIATLCRCPGYFPDPVAKYTICEDIRVRRSCSFLPGRWSSPRQSDRYGSLELASQQWGTP